MREIDTLVVHCAATPPSLNIRAATISHWHTVDNGWRDIGYHYVIGRDGKCEKGRDLDGDGNVDEEVGAHVLGHNAHSIGICLVGGVDEGGTPECNFTRKQYASLAVLLAKLTSEYKGARVLGHSDLDPENKSHCPGFNVGEWWS